MTTKTEPTADEETAATAKRSYSVPAAEKALDVLEFMASQPEGMTITALAGALGRSVHELYRVILVLEARGYLYRRSGSDRYRLSLKLFELAHRRHGLTTNDAVALGPSHLHIPDREIVLEDPMLGVGRLEVLLIAERPIHDAPRGRRSVKGPGAGRGRRRLDDGWHVGWWRGRRIL